MTPEFWSGRNVFVTGHTGFKGAWLSLWLQSMGARVTGYALEPPTDPSLFALAGVARGMTSITGDVRNLTALRRAMEQAEPEVVIHMAAQPLVRVSYANPVETYAVNVMGTVHVLECIRQLRGIKAVVVVSSDKCYENREWHWAYNEEHRLGGRDPYSSSKACTELVVSAYRNSFFPPDRAAEHGVSVASARAGNVIGGGDWARDRLVPDVISALIAGRHPVLRNPHAVRPWQHVLEPLGGYLMLAEALHRDGPRFVGAWNFGPFDYSNRTVSWMAGQLCGVWGGTASWDRDTAPAPHEASLLQVDSSKARTLLGWAPKLDPVTALQWTARWAKAWQAGADLRQFSEEQIRSFCERPAFDPVLQAAACGTKA